MCNWDPVKLKFGTQSNVFPYTKLVYAVQEGCSPILSNPMRNGKLPAHSLVVMARFSLCEGKRRRGQDVITTLALEPQPSLALSLPMRLLPIRQRRAERRAIKSIRTCSVPTGRVGRVGREGLREMQLGSRRIGAIPLWADIAQGARRMSGFYWRERQQVQGSLQTALPQRSSF